jgi:PAS domain S-box-containing protein
MASPKESPKSQGKQSSEIEELRAQLDEANETLRAIREGEVDAVVVSGSRGEQVFSLVGAESIYRLIVETMKEAAFTVTFEGKILYCNTQLGEFLKRPINQILGHELNEFVDPSNHSAAESLLIGAREHTVRQRLVFADAGGRPVPAHISANVLNQPDGLNICVVATNLTELENSTEMIQRLRRQQEALRKSELDQRRQREFFECLIANAGSCIAVLTGRELRYTLANPAFQLFAGDAPVVGRRYREVFPDAGAEALIQRVLETGEPWMVDSYRAPIPGKPDATWQGTVVRLPLVDGEEPSALAVVWDITERKQAEDEMARLASFPILNPNPIVETDWDGNVLYANPCAQKLFPDLHVRGRKHPFLADWMNLKNECFTKTNIVRDITIADSWYHQAIQYIQELQRIRIYGLDITQRKQAEKDLEDSEHRYRQLVQSSPDAIVVHRKGVFLYANAAALKLYGAASLGQLKERNILDLIHPDDKDAVMERMRQVEGGERTQLKEMRVIGLDGLETHVEAYASRVTYGAEKAIQVIIRDITERKLNDLALLESKEAFRTLADNSPDGVDRIDREFRHVYVNSSAAEVLDLNPEDIIGKTNRELGIPDPWTARWEDLVRNVFHTGEPVEFEEEFHGKEGIRFGNIRCVPERAADGQVTSVLAVSRDITAHKRAEQALRESEERLRLLGDNLPESAVYQYTHDANSNIRFVYFSAGIERLNGIRVDEVLRDPSALHRQIPHEYMEKLAEAEERSRQDLSDFDMEVPMKRADGQVRWMRLHSRPRRLPDGGTIWDGVQIDITEMRQTQEALRASEQRIQRVLNSIMEGYYSLDSQWRFVEMNAVSERFFRNSASVLKGKSIWELTGVGVESFLYKKYFEALRSGQPVQFEARSRFNAGAWTMLYLYPRDGALDVYFQDITARKNAEESLRRLNSELEQRVADRTAELERAGERVQAERQRFLDVLETLPVIVMLLRPDYRVEWVNRAYRKALGENAGCLCYAAQFGLDKPCDECQAFEPFKTGQPHQWEWALPNGRTFEIHNFPFADIDGSPMILEMDIDITDRRQAEKELQQAHEDLEGRAAQLRALAAELTLTEQRERKRLALVLHDGLQQMLVAAKFQLALLDRGKNVVEATADISNLIDDCILTSRSLTAELSPPILHRGGLIPALEWLVQWMGDKHGLSVELTTQGQIASAPEEITVLLFQSVRELLFNVAKHAGTRKAQIAVTQFDGHIQVEVADRGVGFNPDKLVQGPADDVSGMGLFSIRERLGYLGGTMSIDAAPGQGTRFVLVAPLAESSQEKSEPAAVRTSISFTSQTEPEKADSTKIRVVLVDDHLVMRQGLASLLSVEPDILVAGEASDGKSAVDLIRNTKPAVVLMDISMPGMDGIQATRIIHNEFPEIRVIGLSMFQEGEQQAAMREAGAVDYLTKTGPSEALINSIRTCVRFSDDKLSGQADNNFRAITSS